MTKENFMKKSVFVLAGLICVNFAMSSTEIVLADELNLTDATVVSAEVSTDSSESYTCDPYYQLYLDQVAAAAAAAQEAQAQTVAETSVVQVTQTRAFKSYENYRKLTKSSSTQKQLQDQAETDINGFRVLNGRYLVATGNGFGMSVGQNFDLLLSNGTVIPCTVGDIKRNSDTDASNIFSRSGCCSEFIVDPSLLPASVKYSGNCSKLCNEWDAVVVSVTIYSM